MLPSRPRLAPATSWLIAGLLAAATLPVQAEGLSPDPLATHWTSRWATRWQVDGGSMDLPAAAAGMRPIALRLYSDYYLDALRLGEGNSGLRLTGGVLAGTRSWLLGSLGTAPASNSDAGSFVTWPYLGVGYSGTRWKSGWGISADLGLAAQTATGLRPSTRLDDALQQVRLQPLLQVEVSYRF